MAEGFVEAKILSSKFYSLYSLLRDLLSKQMHYDWGLRAIKSVLVVAGAFKRAEPDLNEQSLLMRALRDFNTPKIVKQDEVIFFGLLGDLFPGINPPRKRDETLEEAVVTACVKRGLDPDELFRLKVVQLEELLVIREWGGEEEGAGVLLSPLPCLPPPSPSCRPLHLRHGPARVRQEPVLVHAAGRAPRDEARAQDEE